MELTPGRKTAVSLGLYLAVAFASFFPSLVLGLAYFDNDLAYQFVPFRLFLKNQLLEGHFPLWNPYLFGGQPFFANPNTMMCYPLTYLTLLFPIPYDLGVFFFIHMVLAATGMHFWLKTLRLSENACRMGALVFALSGIFWWELIHLQILAAYALFPWLMGLLEGLFKNWNTPRAFLTGLCFALIFSCGGFQSTTCVFYTALAYFLFRIFTGEEAVPSPTGSPLSRISWKKLSKVLLFAAWGGLPLLTQLIPAEEFSQLSNRRDPSQTYENFNGTFSMPPSSTYEFLFPTLGLPEGTTIDQAIQKITNQTNMDNDFLGNFAYLGVWAPLLFFFAFKRKEKKFLFFLISLCLLSVLTAWGRYFPLHRILCAVLPGIDLSRAPFRFIQTYVLFGSVLVAYGFQALERFFSEKGRASGLIFPAIAYGLLLLLVSFARPGETWHEMIALTLGLAGLGLWGMTESWKSLGRWTFQAALIFPLLLTGWGGFTTVSAQNFNYKENLPSLSTLKENPGMGRYLLDPTLVMPMRKNNETYLVPLPENAVVPLEIRDIAGYSPIVLKKYVEMKNLPLKTYFQLMGVRGLLLGRDRGEIPDFTRRPLGATWLYEPKNPPGYLLTPFQFPMPSENEMDLQVMARPDFDPNSQALLESPLPPEILSQLPGKKASLRYEVLKDGPDDQSFQIHLDLNSLVLFSEMNFPGWKAWVDGNPAQILTADHAFRALFVPAGDHQVEFHYVPAWFHPLLWFLAAWSLSAILYAAFLFIPRRTPGIDPPKAN